MYLNWITVYKIVSLTTLFSKLLFLLYFNSNLLENTIYKRLISFRGQDKIKILDIYGWNIKNNV